MDETTPKNPGTDPHPFVPLKFNRLALAEAAEKAMLVMPVGYPAPNARVPDLARKGLDEIAVWM